MSKITVIVPIYNVEKYLGRCIESIINQTYEKLEIILVNDNSPDNCGRICDDYAKKDDRITVVHKENGGVSSARNKGLELCSGDYISFVDPDDYLEHDMYAKLINLFSENNFDIAICGYYENEEGSRTKKVIDDRFEGVKNLSETAENIFLNGFNPAVWNKLFKRELIFRDGVQLVFFQNDLVVGEDSVFVSEVLRKVERCNFINQPLYNYTIRADSVTGTIDIKKMQLYSLARCICIEKLRNVVSKAVVSGLSSRIFMRNCQDYYYLYIKEDIINKNLIKQVYSFKNCFLLAKNIKIRNKVRIIVQVLCVYVRFPRSIILMHMSKTKKD